jgi:hypothetical protein
MGRPQPIALMGRWPGPKGKRPPPHHDARPGGTRDGSVHRACPSGGTVADPRDAEGSRPAAGLPGRRDERPFHRPGYALHKSVAPRAITEHAHPTSLPLSRSSRRPDLRVRTFVRPRAHRSGPPCGHKRCPIARPRLSPHEMVTLTAPGRLVILLTLPPPDMVLQSILDAGEEATRLDGRVRAILRKRAGHRSPPGGVKRRRRPSAALELASPHPRRT